MKIAFLTTRFDRPSYRFRVKQFLPYLRQHGVACDTFIIPASLAARWRLFRAMEGYDLVVLQKKMLRRTDRRILRSSARRIVFDVDDSVMYRERGARAVLCRKRRRRFRAAVRMSDLVLAGNDFLCQWAANDATRVVCFRTVVDTDHYTPAPRSGREPLVIGWIGSSPTNHYLNPMLPVLKRLAHSYPFTLRIVSDSMERIDLADPGELCASFSPWSEATELGELQQFTMGIMPLPANEWAEGKCSLKALLYMACGAPAVCSAVGAATTIITNGEDGFLAGSDAEWYTALERLLKDEPLRARMAERARATVVSRYSVAATAPSLLALFRDACGIKG